VIGHSLGGLYARCFATRYPDRVAGLVLVDATHEHLLDRIKETFGRGALAAQAAMSVGMAVVPRGLFRAGIDANVLLGAARSIMGGTSDEEVRLRAALYLTSGFRKASLAETIAIPETMAVLAAHRGVGSLPLAVVTAADPAADDRSVTARLRPAWVDLQRDLAERSTNSVHLFASKGGHFVYQDDPDIVEHAVKHVVAMT
jgi:pimeloyl-ACP methyl ester carboxylesterase